MERCRRGRGSAGGGCLPGELFISSTFTCSVTLTSVSLVCTWIIDNVSPVLARVYPSLNLFTLDLVQTVFSSDKTGINIDTTSAK